MSFLLFFILLFCVFYIKEPRRMFTVMLFGVVLFLIALYYFTYQLGLATYQVEDYYTINSVYLVFVAISIPGTLLAISVLLFANNKTLMQKEGRRIRNLFSAVIAVALLFILGYSVYFFVASLQGVSLTSSFLYVYIMGLLCYFLWFFFTLALYAILYNATPLFKKPQYIIVLGSGLIGDKVPPLLASRLDRAVKLFKRYNEQPLLITSGGQGHDELVAEAVAMKQYMLEQHGLRDDQVIVEDQSTTTYENLMFSKKIIHDKLGTANGFGAVVTNDFHVLRASIYTRKVGLHAKGVAAKTTFYYVPNAFTREYIGMLQMYVKWHSAFLALYTVAFIGLYMLFR